MEEDEQRPPAAAGHDEDFVQIAAHQVLRSVKRSTFAPRVLR
jgi:hypothetical protein